MYAQSSASEPVSVELAAEVVGETAVIDEVVESAVVEEATANGGFDFWAAIKKFFEGVFDYFDGDNGNQYEEYAGS